MIQDTGLARCFLSNIPNELGLVGIIEAHEQLSIFSNVADKVLEVNIQTIRVGCVENGLAPQI